MDLRDIKQANNALEWTWKPQDKQKYFGKGLRVAESPKTSKNVPQRHWRSKNCDKLGLRATELAKNGLEWRKSSLIGSENGRMSWVKVEKFQNESFGTRKKHFRKCLRAIRKQKMLQNCPQSCEQSKKLSEWAWEVQEQQKRLKLGLRA